VGIQPRTFKKDAGEESFLPVFAALFQGIAANAIKGDPDQYRQFRAKMQKVADLDGIRESAPELSMKADMAINFLQHHCIRADEYYTAQIGELKSMADLLVGTLADLGVGKPESMRQLRELAQKLQLLDHAPAMRQAKTELAQCLTEIRQAAERGLNGNPGASERDPVTSLPARTSAEAALVEACASESPTCVVFLLLDRLRLYNQRYGREVGDKVMIYFAEFLKHSFRCGDALFRWTGPALLMLRPGPVDKVQPEMRRVLDQRQQFDCDAGSRHLLLSVDAVWSVLPMMVDPRMLVNKIDSLMTG
jgi:diguanylate cyclase (GGDEF)-like protein